MRNGRNFRLDYYDVIYMDYVTMILARRVIVNKTSFHLARGNENDFPSSYIVFAECLCLYCNASPHIFTSCRVDTSYTVPCIEKLDVKTSTPGVCCC